MDRKHDVTGMFSSLLARCYAEVFSCNLMNSILSPILFEMRSGKQL